MYVTKFNGLFVVASKILLLKRRCWNWQQYQVRRANTGVTTGMVTTTAGGKGI